MFGWFKKKVDTVKESTDDSGKKKTKKIVRVIPYDVAPEIAKLDVAVQGDVKSSYCSRMTMWRKIAECVPLVLQYPAELCTESPLMPYIIITVPHDFENIGDPGIQTYTRKSHDEFEVVQHPSDLTFGELIKQYRELSGRFIELRRIANLQEKRIRELSGCGVQGSDETADQQEA